MPKNSRTLLNQALDVVQAAGGIYKTFNEIKQIAGFSGGKHKVNRVVSIKDPNNEHWAIDGKMTPYLAPSEHKRNSIQSQPKSNTAVQITLPTQTGLQMVSSNPFQFKTAPKLRHNPEKIPPGVRVQFNGYLSDMINKLTTNYNGPGSSDHTGWCLNPIYGMSGTSGVLDSLLAGSTAAQGMAKAFRRYRVKFLQIEYVACCASTTAGCLTTGYTTDAVSAATDATFVPSSSTAFAALMGFANSMTTSNTVGGKMTIINELGEGNDIDDLFFLDAAHDSSSYPYGYRQSQQGAILAFYDGLATGASTKTHMARYNVVYDFYEPTSRSVVSLVHQKLNSRGDLVGYSVQDGPYTVEVKETPKCDPRSSAFDSILVNATCKRRLSALQEDSQDDEFEELESEQKKLKIVEDPPYPSVRKPRSG